MRILSPMVTMATTYGNARFRLELNSSWAQVEGYRFASPSRIGLWKKCLAQALSVNLKIENCLQFNFVEGYWQLHWRHEEARWGSMVNSARPRCTTLPMKIRGVSIRHKRYHTHCTTSHGTSLGLQIALDSFATLHEEVRRNQTWPRCRPWARCRARVPRHLRPHHLEGNIDETSDLGASMRWNREASAGFSIISLRATASPPPR